MSDTSKSAIKILIINLHSFYNAGDAALAQVAIQQLLNAFPGSSITLSMNEPDSYTGEITKVGSFLHWMHTSSGDGKLHWRYFTIIRIFVLSLIALLTYKLLKRPFLFGLTPNQQKSIKVYFESDIIISAPGNFLYSSGKFGFTFLIIAYTIIYAFLAGKPLYMLPQSIGPLHNFRDKLLTKWIINHARIVMVREQISQKEIQKIGITNSQCLLIPDLAFNFEGTPVKEAKAWLYSYGIDITQDQPLLGLTMINWGAQTSQAEIQNRYENSLLNLSNYFLETTNGKIIFFPQVYSNTIVSDDRIPTQRVINRIQKISQVVYINDPTPPALLKTSYGLMNIFIGTRMHSNIFALSEGVPVIAIAYRYKTLGIMQMLGLEKWVIDIENISSETLISMYIDLWKEQDTVRQYIKSKVSILAKEAKIAGKLISSDFSNLNRL